MSTQLFQILQIAVRDVLSHPTRAFRQICDLHDIVWSHVIKR